MIHPEAKKLLAPFTTMGIGGPADFFIEVKSVDEMAEAFAFARVRSLPIHIIGKGSNTLFDDRGLQGVAILNKIDYFEDLGNGTFKVGAGFSFPLLGSKTAKAGYSGFEFAPGIPASCGGAIFMNAGANGQETSTHLVEVDYIDFNDGPKRFKKEDLHFRYRYSSFQTWQGAIIGATFHLPASSTARKKQLEIIAARTKSQPYEDKSAGCVFRNPDCGKAGQMIDEAGLKGFQIGGAQVSPKHANFIVNKGGAKAEEIIALLLHIQSEIQNRQSVHLEPEVRIIPYDPRC